MKFRTTNKAVCQRTLALKEAEQLLTIDINGEINIRSKENSEAKDIPKGFESRNLTNFDHLRNLVTVKDNYKYD